MWSIPTAPSRDAASPARDEANRRFLQVVDELRPDLILLHFADKIANETLAEARRLARGVVIVDINIDPIDTEKNQRRLALRRGVADALFVTAAEPALGSYVEGAAFAAYLPNPVDVSVETGRGFETETAFDLLFPVNDDAPRELGERLIAPSAAIAGLAERLPQARLNSPGLRGSPRARGVRYLEALRSARIGWSLSRRASLPLYASDRMVHMMGFGLATALDRRAGLQRFYGDDAAIFYDDLDDLAAQLRPLLADDDAARALAKAGWEVTWRLFDSGQVFTYLLAQLFDDGGARGYEWPMERWRS